MNYKEFCEKVKAAVQAALGNEYCVGLVRTDKLNGLTRQSIVIHKPGEMVAPNIYLESFFQEYQSGRQLASIAGNIIAIYNTADKQPELHGILFSDFQAMKDRLYCKLINFERNAAFLKSIPHIRWMDLAVIFCILVKKNSDGIGSITVKNDLMERWEVTADTLYSEALENTPLLFEASVKPMDEIIRSMAYGQPPASESDGLLNEAMSDILQQHSIPWQKQPMYVAGNKSALNGAVWMLQKNEVRDLSKKLDCSLYILPSSVHEVIVVPFTECIPRDTLHRMVQEVNATQVAPDEFLSDNVYFYNQEDDTLLPLY